MESLGPNLIYLAALVAVLSYVFRLRSLSSEDRQAEIRAGMDRARPYAEAWAFRRLPIWLVAALGMGALGYGGAKMAAGFANLGPGPGPAGGGVLTIFRRGGGTTPSGAVGVPNAPSGTVVVVDTSTVYFLASAFVGSGADTQDSVRFAVTRLAADTTAILTEVKTATVSNARDTIVDQANLKADTTYKGYFKYSGVAGKWSAWSAPDTFVNRVGIVALVQADWTGVPLGNYGHLPDTGAVNAMDGVFDTRGGLQHHVITPPAGFPAGMTRVYRNVSDVFNNGFCLLAVTDIPVLADGATRYYRFYWRAEVTASMVTGSGENGDHPVHQSNGFSPVNSNWFFGVDWPAGSTTKWGPSFWTMGGGGAQYTLDTLLDKNTVYRFEIAETRSGSNFTITVDVYNEATSTTVPVFNSGDWLNGATAVNASSKSYVDVNYTAYFTFGLNDFDDTDWQVDAPMNYASWGGIAIADNQGAIGAYGSVIGEN